MSADEQVAKFLPQIEGDETAVLILAGDTCSKPYMLGDFLNAASDQFMHVFVVPGNHEYYGHVRADQDSIVKHVLANNPKVTYTGMGVETLELEQATLVGSIMWGGGYRTPEEYHLIQRYLRDHYVIHDDGGLDEFYRQVKLPFTPDTMKYDNQQLRTELINHFNVCPVDKPLVAVTHHLPFYELCHPRFGGNIDAGFACQFEELLVDGNRRPDHWIFGHTHDTIERVLHDIHFHCNPYGYRRENCEGEFNQWRSDKRIMFGN